MTPMDNSRLGTCEMCSSVAAKYTCPGCEINTCSVKCVKDHKTAYDCDGKRNKTAYKPLSKLSDTDFQSDYGLLEEVANTVDSCSREQRNKKEYQIINDLPKFLACLRKAAHERDMKLWFMPIHFSRRKLNRSYYSIKSKTIEWTVQCRFFKSLDKFFVVTGDKLSEKTLLSDCISSIIAQCKETWASSCSFQLCQYEILLQSENISDAKNRFFLMDQGKTLEDNLKGHTIVEFPLFAVIRKEMLSHFKIISIEQAKKEIAELIEKRKKFIEGNAQEDNIEKEDMEADLDSSINRKRARLEISSSNQVAESDEEMEVAGNFFNL